MLFFLSLVISCVLFRYVSADTFSRDRNCSCGFYDPHTRELFTDSIITYFNETNDLPHDFVAEDYEHKYEKDWNSGYRQGAEPSNLQFDDSGSLQLTISPPTDTHLVNGAGIRTARRDIHHGSFRTFIKSPRKDSGGSAVSMMWQYNETEVAELSVMNTDDPSQAWIGNFVNAEHTTYELGVNFSTVWEKPVVDRNYTTLGGVLANGSIDAWNFTEYRMDWTEDYINFYVGGNLTRSILHQDNAGMPSVPASFYFKHWSTGNRFSMQGPPRKRSVADIGWIRMFFNSSSSTKDAREEFAARCPLEEACSMADVSLRGSTPYSEQATQKWKQENGKSVKRMPSLWISVICIAFSFLLLLHAFISRAPWRKLARPAPHSLTSATSNEKTQPSPVESPEKHIPSEDSTIPAPSISRSQCSEYSYESRNDPNLEPADPSPETSVWGGSTHGGPSRADSLRFGSRVTTPHILCSYSNNSNGIIHEFPLPTTNPVLSGNIGHFPLSNPSENTLAVTAAPSGEDKVQMTTVTESALPAPRMTPHPPPPRERIDYLAGLVALCAILVTVMHFGLTFVPAMVVPGAPRHYESEYWAQQIIAPFILNQMWLGVFFTTSVRFLVAGYLKKGNMETIAKAAVRRTPRLMIPVASIALLEYFLIDCGATKYLRYIPSMTWSTWPYVTRFPTVGHFVSEVLELIYLIPNAVPQITYNFCTGVLWTIAVQLQGTWLVLCGVIVVYEITTPWKRMCYYALCVLSHWYAQSWGSYLWLGLLLTDLDITYKYKQYLHARPLAYYPLVTFFWLCVVAGFAANMISNWTPFDFSTYEHDIHPDATTGEPLWNTHNAGYPAYYIPRLNGLLFAAGMQAIVELSPTVQWVLSLPFLLVLFPHIFTIYLLHGLVFWSWGSWLMIFIADRGFSYGINVTIVGITSYVLLFAILPIVTPIIEALGKDITALVWMSATEKSPPRRRTLFPFPGDLFERREKKDDVEGGRDGVVASMGSKTPTEKGKGKEKIELQEITQFDFRGNGNGQAQG